MRRPKTKLPPDPSLDARKEAVKTYIEQTKLLVALASAFVVAPAALVTVFASRTTANLGNGQLLSFIFAEILFVASVLFGYFVLSSIAGAQDQGQFDVYRPATMNTSLFQLGSYILGMIVFIGFGYSVASTPALLPAPPPPQSPPTIILQLPPAVSTAIPPGPAAAPVQPAVPSAATPAPTAPTKTPP